MHLSLTAAALLSAVSVQGHMIMGTPPPFGDPSSDPLKSSGADFPCKLQGDPATFYTGNTTTMAIGETQTLSLKGSAVHGGGSCQLAITSDKHPSPSSTWQVILSMEGGCPTKDGTNPSTYDYTIPASVAPGDYVFAWTWVSHNSGAPEYYMNCAPITVTGGKTRRDTAAAAALPNLFVANLASINDCKTQLTADVVYPDPGPNLVKPGDSSLKFVPGIVTGSNCYPLGASGSASSGSSAPAAGPGAGSGSGAASALSVAASGPSSSYHNYGSSSATTGTSTANSEPSAGSNGQDHDSSSAPAASASTSSAGSGSPNYSSSATSSGATGAVSSAVVSAAASPSSAIVVSAVAPAPVPAPATATDNVPAPVSTAAAGSGTSSAALSGPCTAEGTFNCDGTNYQQCASGSWTAMRPLAAGQRCVVGQSQGLFSRGLRIMRRGIRREE